MPAIAILGKKVNDEIEFNGAKIKIMSVEKLALGQTKEKEV